MLFNFDTQRGTDMKNSLIKIALSTMLVGSAAFAQQSSEYEVNTYSLMGVEGGYSSFDYERENDAGKTTRTTNDLLHGGIKIGAQSQNYRIFLSAKFFDMSDFDYARMYGIEGQYMFNFSKIANFFIGVDVGTTDMKLIDKKNDQDVKVYKPYYGGDMGFNIHLGESFDWEIGARYLTINKTIEQDDIKYSFDRIIMGYTSFIFKYKMD